MTLLGKLFRPWDLPKKEEGEIDIIMSKEEEELSLPNSPQISSIRSSKERRESGGGRGDKRVCRVRRERVKREEEEVVADVVMEENTRCTSAGKSDSDPSSYSNYNWPSHEDCSPRMSLDSSQLFLHPSAIRDLANLSRTELTAMGLIGPECAASHKVKRQRPKRFHCPHCQVAFSNNGQLRGHIRIHTGERPFSCEQEGCGKSFTRNEELTRHRRIHSGLRPFPCTYCGKKFGRKDHLKKHTRTHQRPMFNAGMIGFGNPFLNPFNPPMPSELNQGSYGLPFVLGPIPPPSSAHFHYS